MEIKLKFLALAKDLAGRGEATLEIPNEADQTVESFLARLLAAFPRLEEIKDQVILAHNFQYVDLQDLTLPLALKGGDEVAILPPVSEICEDKFDVNRYLAHLSHPGCGGTSIFIGTSRCSSKISDKYVKALDYSAYVPMALKQLKEVCLLVRHTSSNIGNIVLAHRVGYVPVGEPGLFVGVSAPHRQDAIKCMDLAITQLKAVVPVWKQEVYEDDTRAWTVNPECFWLSNNVQTSTQLNKKPSNS